MYRLGVFGVGLGFVVVLTFSTVYPKILSSLFDLNSSPHDHSDDSSNQNASHQMSHHSTLAIIAPTVTPTPWMQPENTLAVAVSEDPMQKTAPDTSPDSPDADLILPESTATNEEPAVAAQMSTAEATLPAMAPVLLPTPTPEPVAEPTTAAIAQATAPDSTLEAPPRDSESDHCRITAPPEPLGLDSFYTKYCSAKGLSIVASGAVSDQAMTHAWQIVTHMLAGISQEAAIRETMINLRLRIGIIGVNQATTHMPEHSNLYALFPAIDWDSRTRAIGATPQMPLLSVSEENLLCRAGDAWQGQNLLVHEFAHAIKNLGFDFVDPHLHATLLQAYDSARAAGLWAGTYVISDVEEYWAEGVRLYFQIHPQLSVPGGQPYPANSRAELQEYDPELYRIIQQIFGPKEGIPPCP